MIDLLRQEAPPVSGGAVDHRSEFFELMATPVEPDLNPNEVPSKETKAEELSTPIEDQALEFPTAPKQGTREEIEETFNANYFPTAPTVKPASARGVNNEKPTYQTMVP